MTRTLLTWSSVVALGAASLIAYGTAGAVAPSAQQPRDPRPNQPRPPSNAEKQLLTVEEAAERDRTNASTQHLVATFYHAKLSDPTLSRDDRAAYIQRGLAAEDRALLADPELLEAIVYKSLLLRAAAEIEQNPETRARLVQLADDLRLQAAVARRTTTAADLQHTATYPAPPPPPPPPVSGVDHIEWTYADTSFVTADGGSAPKKAIDVRPVYPPMALQMGVQGRVVVEAGIDAQGRVVSARVVESIPLLNQSAIDAIKQWRFDPATLAGTPIVTVILVEARFFPRKR